MWHGCHSRGTQGDAAVVKLAGSDGTELWRISLDGTASSGADLFNAVALDSYGNAVAAGWLVNTGRFTDYSVAKVNGPDGALLWHTDLYGTDPNGYDQALAVAVDAAGDVLSTGRLDNGNGTPPRSDIGVVKLAGADGAERWRRSFNPGQHADLGEGRSIAVDAAGDVVAGGFTENPDWVIALKLRGADGGDFTPEWFYADLARGGRSSPEPPGGPGGGSPTAPEVRARDHAFAAAVGQEPLAGWLESPSFPSDKQRPPPTEAGLPGFLDFGWPALLERAFCWSLL